MRKFVTAIDRSFLEAYKYELTPIVNSFPDMPIVKFQTARPNPDDICTVTMTIEDRWHKSKPYLLEGRNWRAQQPLRPIGKRVILRIFLLPGQALRQVKFRLLFWRDIHPPPSHFEVLGKVQQDNKMTTEFVAVCLYKGEQR